MPAVSRSIKTLADLVDRVGGIPLDRIRFRPFPGTATVQDVIDIQRREGRLCELVEGVLLEKAVGYNESSLAVFLAGVLNAFVLPRNLGLVTGSDGTVELVADLVRIPDVAFTSWDRLPGRRRPTSPVPLLAPNLAVEVLSRSNTPGEMAAKREEYFAAGVQLVWEVDPRVRTVVVYTSLTQSTTLGPADTLDGGVVLPGFTLPLQTLFGELDRQG
ncbi:MAG TPA: Uma2 family endonuclease [Gemmataceae bacterium]|jgi:Uma2 family endonuclease|nr:Uma2 family endonuclease [Gemmataceae bacterium]